MAAIGTFNNVYWPLVLGFNATLTAKVISWRCVTHVSWLSHTSTDTTFFPRPMTTFLTCFCRGESTPERKFASARDQTHNHLVMKRTRLPLSHLGGAQCLNKNGHSTLNHTILTSNNLKEEAF